MLFALLACVSTECGGHVAADLTWTQDEQIYNTQCAGPFEFVQEDLLYGQGQCIHEDHVIDISYEGQGTDGTFTVTYDLYSTDIYESGWQDKNTIQFSFEILDLPYDAELFAIIVDKVGD